MKAVRIVSGTGVPLKRSDVDTDQIIPAEWLKRVERTGFEKGLFSTWRDDRDFVLNDERYAGASILVAGPAFGVGSSREHAVWAIQQGGFDAVIAPSFTDIFRNNCTKNGLVPVVLPEATVERDLGRDRGRPDDRDHRRHGAARRSRCRRPASPSRSRWTRRPSTASSTASTTSAHADPRRRDRHLRGRPARPGWRADDAPSGAAEGAVDGDAVGGSSGVECACRRIGRRARRRSPSNSYGRVAGPHAHRRRRRRRQLERGDRADRLVAVDPHRRRRPLTDRCRTSHRRPPTRRVDAWPRPARRSPDRSSANTSIDSRTPSARPTSIVGPAVPSHENRPRSTLRRRRTPGTSPTSSPGRG